MRVRHREDAACVTDHLIEFGAHDPAGVTARPARELVAAVANLRLLA